MQLGASGIEAHVEALQVPMVSEISLADSGVYRFGPFEFDPEAGELRRQGFRVPLEPQPTKVLGLLLEKAGHTVTREELRLHVWGPGTYVDFERGLAYCIAQVRSALGDSAESARYVQTLPRRGFRFLAPVQHNGGGQAAVGVAGSPGVATRAGWRTKSLAMAMLIVGAAALGITLWRGKSQTPTSQPNLRVAIATFDNESGNPTLDPVARGLSDAVVARLAQLQSDRLGIIGNAAILQRARTFRDVKDIGRELSADYVVLGQLQRIGAQTRVIVHLIRTDDETHLWADRFDRESPDWLALQSEIADAVALAVNRKLLSTGSDIPGAPQAGS
jgi:TolB-like protein/DNA-binding winged helix-turn-helix (wHTH) protein